MIRLLLISLVFVSCTGKNMETVKKDAVIYPVQLQQTPSDSLLAGIQVKIYNAFVHSLMSKENTALVKLSTDLEELNKTRKQNLILYWRSYLQFYSSIYHLEKGAKETAEKEIDKGIDWMDDMKKKNSEDYALLALLQGFGIQFKGIQAMFISGAIKKNAKQAMAIDATNIRGYYVFANNDFYTPEKYGGGKEAEEYLLKAIALPAQNIKNEYLPSWGKEESYEILIRLYIQNENWDLAKKYFQEGIGEFPESYAINQLAAKLVRK